MSTRLVSCPSCRRSVAASIEAPYCPRCRADLTAELFEPRVVSPVFRGAGRVAALALGVPAAMVGASIFVAACDNEVGIEAICNVPECYGQLDAGDEYQFADAQVGSDTAPLEDTGSGGDAQPESGLPGDSGPDASGDSPATSDAAADGGSPSDAASMTSDSGGPGEAGGASAEAGGIGPASGDT